MKRMISSFFAISMLSAGIANAEVVSLHACTSLGDTGAKFCVEIDEATPANYAVSLVEKGDSLQVSSNQTYQNVDSEALLGGLKKLVENGLTQREAAHIIGPVLDGMHDTAMSTSDRQDLIDDFASYISRQ